MDKVTSINQTGGIIAEEVNVNNVKFKTTTNAVDYHKVLTCGDCKKFVEFEEGKKATNGIIIFSDDGWCYSFNGNFPYHQGHRKTDIACKDLEEKNGK